MDIRTAILKAADDFESNPSLFNWLNGRIPDCGTPGCALAYIGLHMGYPTTARWYDVSIAEFGTDPVSWYRRVSDADGHDWNHEDNWHRSATQCVRGLRLYADKYHPADKGTDDLIQPPDWEALAKPDAGTFATV